MYIGKATYEKDDKIMNYNEARKKFEKKWQLEWEKSGIYEAKDESRPKAAGAARVKKYFAMFEFPYPSGAGMHVGHVRSQTAMDIITRKRRMEGFNVLYPIGWDAFGLPTENYAIKMGIDPAVATKQNTENFTRQLKAMGFGLDWSREIDTTDPNYYKWTQWMFLKFFEKGLAYKAKTFINWCPKDKIGLANEEAAGGVCDRCGGPVEKREKEQWMIRITDYADKLLEGLKTVDYIPQAKAQQENWIGRSEGAEIEFPIVGSEKGKMRVFTTRPDTIFGATFLVIAPEHPRLTQALDDPNALLTNKDEVRAYIEATKKNTELERTAENGEKTGVELKGLRVINPATKEEIPVWTADYVLANYGTGIIMAVPAHDERDLEFAKKYELPIRHVIQSPREKYAGTNVFLETAGGKFIFQKRDKNIEIWPGKIALFGGKRDSDETPLQCAIREIKEEVELSLKEDDLEYIGDRVFGRDDSKFIAMFVVRGVDPKLIVVHEGEGFEELTLGEALNHKDTAPLCKEAILLFQNEKSRCFTDNGTLVNSGRFDGMESETAKKAITEAVGGKVTVKYKLRDWVFSRQRYWGEPIPLVHCEKDGWVPVPEKDLPVELPKVEKYQPTDTGESPLANITDWVNTKCPKCKGPAKRETDTMPNWAGSSWYFLRYADISDKIFKERKPLRKQIKASDSDRVYFEAFKKIYSDLEAKNIPTWTVNRFLLNGINKKQWLALKTVALMAWESDVPAIFEYLKQGGHKLVTENKGGHLFDRDGIRVEIIPIFKNEKGIWSFTLEGNLQGMTMEDLPVIKNGELFDFPYHTVSPQYNLKHYQDIEHPEDKEKIEFLKEWVDEINENLRYWMQVDWYNGGMEHTVLHLLYSRFWNMFLYDLGLVPTSEPYAKRTSHGMVLAADGSKMSKSLGNVINPDDIIAEFGADALRLYEMFMGPFNQAISWDPHGILGCSRFLERVWNVSNSVILNESEGSKKQDSSPVAQNDSVTRLVHKTLKKVGTDIESMAFNTAISAMMVLANALSDEKEIGRNEWEIFLKILAPFAPHMTEELWLELGNMKSIHIAPWPEFDPKLLIEDSFELVIQINGKIRDKVSVLMNINQAEVEKIVLVREETKKWLTATPKKVIFVKNRLINLII